MDSLRCCLLISLALALLAQSVLSAPALEDSDLTKVIDSVIGDSRSRRDVADGPEPAPIADEEPSVLLTRLRRNLAQMYVASRHFNDYSHGRSYNRFRHRRLRHHSRRHHRHGAGQLADA